MRERGSERAHFLLFSHFFLLVLFHLPSPPQKTKPTKKNSALLRHRRRKRAPGRQDRDREAQPEGAQVRTGARRGREDVSREFCFFFFVLLFFFFFAFLLLSLFLELFLLSSSKTPMKYPNYHQQPPLRPRGREALRARARVDLRRQRPQVRARAGGQGRAGGGRGEGCAGGERHGRLICFFFVL